MENETLESEIINVTDIYEQPFSNTATNFTNKKMLYFITFDRNVYFRYEYLKKSDFLFFPNKYSVIYRKIWMFIE